MHQKTFYVYILTNELRTVLYTGVSSDLLQRITEHYQNRGQEKTFCGKYNVYYPLYFESSKYVIDAIAREKEIKGWRREKKLQLIATANPEL